MSYIHQCTDRKDSCNHTPLTPELYYHLFSSTPLTLITIHLVKTYSDVQPTRQMYKHTVSSCGALQINSARYYRKLILREIREMHHPAEISKMHPILKKANQFPRMRVTGKLVGNLFGYLFTWLLRFSRRFAVVRGVAAMIHGLCPIRTIVLLLHGLLHSSSSILY